MKKVQPKKMMKGPETKEELEAEMEKLNKVEAEIEKAKSKLKDEIDKNDKK